MSFVPYLLLHSLASSIIFTLTKPKIHKCCRAILSTWLVVHMVGLNMVIDILFNLLCFLCISYLVSGNRIVIWFFTVLIFQVSEFFISSASYEVSLFIRHSVSHEWFVLLYAAHFYIILRGLSVALSIHRLSDKSRSSTREREAKVEPTIKCDSKFSLTILLDALDYSFYPHALFLGPLILYSEWHDFWVNCNSLSSSQSASFKTLFSILLSLLFKAIRLLFWNSFWSLCLCFVYPNSFGYLFPYVQLHDLSNRLNKNDFVIDRGTIGAIMSLRGLHLFMTYLQFYGWPYVLINLEWLLINLFNKLLSVIHGSCKKNLYEVRKSCDGLHRLQVSYIPDPPSCLLHVLLTSECWRSFDRGLYNFIKSYIFLPVINYEVPLTYKYSNIVQLNPTIKTVLALILSYLFVLLYHGIDQTNMIWLFCNLLVLFSERLVKWVYLYTDFGSELRHHLSTEWIRRLSLLLCALSGIFSVLGNFYFLIGFRAAHQLSKWVVYDPTLRLTLFVFAYCHLNLVTDLRSLFPSLRPQSGKRFTHMQKK
nr:unnamed protein product [Trichobilharzia regenti]